MDLTTLHDHILPIIQEAELIASTKFGTDIKRSYKSDEVSKIAIVTEVDLEIDALLRKKLTELFPETGFITEEGTQEGLKEYNWIIDPIDGTMNYSRGIPMFAISIGLWRGNEPLYGSISLPMLGDRLHGWIGGGLWLNGQKLETRTLPETPQKAYVVLGDAAEPAEFGRVAEAISRSVNSHHDFGSCVYQAFLALTHKAELAVFYNVALWDIGAVSPLAQEAGLALNWISPRPDLATVKPKAYQHTMAIGLPELVDKVSLALTAIMES